MTFINRVRFSRRGRPLYFISLCAVVILIFTVAHWRSYNILVNETANKIIYSGRGNNVSMVRVVSRFLGAVIQYPTNNAIADAICSSKDFLFFARCHKGILGVPLSNIYKYRPSKASQFVCLESGEQVSWSAVNDDYCDCDDGSDEPGTGACPNTRFYCLSEKKYIPASRINDGICDCCDGSDEWKRLTVGGDVLTLHNIDISYSPCTDACIKKEKDKTSDYSKQQLPLYTLIL